MTDPKDPSVTTSAAPETPPATPPTTTPAAPAAPPAAIIPPLEEKEVEPELRKVDGEKDPEEYKIPDDADLLDPKVARDVIAKSVEAKIKVVKSDMQTEQVRGEVKSIIDAHPEYKPYADKIMKWVTHPNRINFVKNGFPVNSVVLEAIAPHLEKIGAEKARLADEKARRSAGDGGGKPAVTTTTKIDFKSMSTKDILEYADKVKAGLINS